MKQRQSIMTFLPRAKAVFAQSFRYSPRHFQHSIHLPVGDAIMPELHGRKSHSMAQEQLALNAKIQIHSAPLDHGIVPHDPEL